MAPAKSMNRRQNIFELAGYDSGMMARGFDLRAWWMLAAALCAGAARAADAPATRPAVVVDRGVVQMIKSDRVLVLYHVFEYPPRKSLVRIVPETLFINGKPATHDNVAKGMLVTVTRDKASGAVQRIEARPPQAGEIPKASDVKLKAHQAAREERKFSGMLTRVEGNVVVAGGVGTKIAEVLIATEATTMILLDGEPAKLEDLRPGMPLFIVQVEGLTARIEAKRPGHKK